MEPSRRLIFWTELDALEVALGEAVAEAATAGAEGRVNLTAARAFAAEPRTVVAATTTAVTAMHIVISKPILLIFILAPPSR